ncbi:EscU/YscU/HrcU family type III secretion system export apparatus switch protein [Phenylobacterium aquaticum]|uniref:EscU/YscU/HrcU family type III secretion system export apparatus switch protein n=1 Tax=Phenylobacterium aquaticum TaxID=1763816 RepID=UPI0026EBE4F3|nr:EscU/YscU/HrcU family type III secretion system export apparatus switch protein [Phenylobacterium aquaticum]
MSTDTPSRRVAVALRYESGGAPQVVASGRGLTGERIIAVAEAHGVPMTHNPPLAQALSTLELETEIPERLYVAVAEVLGFLLKAAKD